MQGAHCRGHNENSIGICIVGDNTVAGEEWTRKQLMSYSNTIKGLRLVWPNIEVFAHNELGKTKCPGYTGDQLRDLIEDDPD